MGIETLDSSSDDDDDDDDLDLVLLDKLDKPKSNPGFRVNLDNLTDLECWQLFSKQSMVLIYIGYDQCIKLDQM